jgi:hypothetical protein
VSQKGCICDNDKVTQHLDTMKSSLIGDKNFRGKYFYQLCSFTFTYQFLCSKNSFLLFVLSVEVAMLATHDMSRIILFKKCSQLNLIFH